MKHIFSQLLICCVFMCMGQMALCQNAEKLFSDPVQLKIKEEISRVKASLIRNKVDTSKFDYYPVVHATLCTARGYPETHSTIQKPILSEVFLVKKSSLRIIGTYKFCLNNKACYSILKRKYGFSTFPCRYDDRLSYTNTKCYGKIKKFLKKEGTLVMIQETGSLWFFCESSAPEHICDQ